MSVVGRISCLNCFLAIFAELYAALSLGDGVMHKISFARREAVLYACKYESGLAALVLYHSGFLVSDR